MMDNSAYKDKPKVQPLVAQFQLTIYIIAQPVREIKVGNNDRQ
jgi:hypothetical protein